MTRLKKTAGFGLKGLSERAKNIGGWLDVSSTPGRGTSITLTLPLQHHLINPTALKNP
jgi:two-component system sensor histidine kinase UhpB